MDDFVVLHHDKAQLHTWRLRCSLFSNQNEADK